MTRAKHVAHRAAAQVVFDHVPRLEYLSDQLARVERDHYGAASRCALHAIAVVAAHATCSCDDESRVCLGLASAVANAMWGRPRIPAHSRATAHVQPCHSEHERAWP